MADPTDPTTTTPSTDFTGTTQGAQQAKISIDQLNGSAATFNNILDGMTIALAGTTGAFKGFNAGAKDIQGFNDQVKGLTNYSKVASDVIEKLTTSVFGAGSVINKTTGALVGMAEKIMNSADNALSLERGLLQIAGASGNMGKTFEAAGPHLLNINNMLQDYGVRMNEMAQSTNTSLDVISSNWAEMGKAIPGSINQQVQATDEAGQKMNNLEATMKLASGTGQTFSQVVHGLTTAWEDYGLEGQKALEFTADMYALSDKFGVNLNYTTKFLTDNANAFKLVSSGATDAAKTYNRMFDSFRSSGVSAKESSELIGDLTNRVATLSVAQKAFLSAQSGGPGGLRGAYQVDNMLRAGKTDEVLKMVEDNLKKHFGGKVYTQEEAGQSDYAATQYTKQKLMLQSGAFGNLVGTGPEGDNKAARILDAFSKGTSASSELKAPSEVLQKAVSQGTDIQKQSYTVMSDSLHELQKMTTLAEINSLDKIQKYLGGTERTDRGVIGDSIIADQAKYLNDDQLKASRRADQNTATVNVGGHINGNEERKNSLESVAEQIKTLIPKSFKDMFTSLENKYLKSGVEGDKGYQDAIKTLNKDESDIKTMIRSQGKATSSQASSLNDISNTKNRLVDFHQAYDNLGSKSFGVGQAVQQAQQVSGKQNTSNQTYQSNSNVVKSDGGNKVQEVNVKISGIVCENCHTPLRPDVHSNVITQGSH